MEKTDLVPILNRGIEYFLVLFKSLQKMRLLSVILLEENRLLTAMLLDLNRLYFCDDILE